MIARLSSTVSVRGRIAGALLHAIFIANTAAFAESFDHSAICEAIKNEWVIRLVYRADEGERTVVPRYLGYTKRGDIIMNGHQLAGFSKSGNLPGARSFRLDRTSKITFTKEVIPGPPGLDRRHSGIERMICSKPPG